MEEILLTRVSHWDPRAILISKPLSNIGCAKDNHGGDGTDDDRPVDCGILVRGVPHVADGRLEEEGWGGHG